MCNKLLHKWLDLENIMAYFEFISSILANFHFRDLSLPNLKNYPLTIKQWNN